jgi:O-antigen/teichoic acid export membrane protein
MTTALPTMQASLLSTAWWQRRVLRDSVVNIAFGVAKALLVLVLIRVAGVYLSAAALGIFLLSRRFSFTVANLAQLGMSQTLLRFIPMSRDEDEKERWTQFALVVLVALAAILLPSMYLLRHSLARFFFGDSGVSAAATLWTVLVIVAAVAHYYAISALFARHRIVASNTVELASNALPLIVLLLMSKEGTTVEQLLRMQAIALGALAILVLGVLAARGRWLLTTRDFGTMTRILATYGLTRALIPFLEMLILSIGPWLIRSRTVEAGYLVIALSLVQLIQIVTTPLSQVSSIVGARLTAHEEEDRIGAGIRALIGCAMYAAILIVAVAMPWADVAIRVWLKEPDLSAGVTRAFVAILAAIIPLAAYFAAKGVIEVRWTQPFNLWSLAAGAVVQFAAYHLLARIYGPTGAILIAVPLSLWIVGVLTVIWIRRYLPQISFWGLGRLLVTGALLFAMNIALRRTLGTVAFVPAAIVSCALAAFLLLRVWPSQFVVFLTGVLRGAQSGAAV